MNLLSIIIWIITLLSPSASFEGKGWRGIVPLRSARADVEALLGQGTNECKCSYYQDDMNIFFVYSSGDCESGGSGGWNIAPETVIRFTIYPKTKPQLSELNIDESKFEKEQGVGDSLEYINAEQGFSMAVQQGTVMSFNYGPASGDESLRCLNYDGIHYSSSIPKELRPRLAHRLSQFVGYSRTRNYEKQYQLYLPAFAAKMFAVKNSREFGKLVRSSGAFDETWIEFKLLSVTDVEDKTYGKVYEVFGIATTSTDGKSVESHRKTRVIIKDKEWYFVDLFWLIPM